MLYDFNNDNNINADSTAFSALTLLVGRRKGIWPVKNWAVGCWHGYLSGARCRLAYGPADATATQCLLLQIGFTFLVPAHPGSPGKGPLNVCVCVLILLLLCTTFCNTTHSKKHYTNAVATHIFRWMITNLWFYRRHYMPKQIVWFWNRSPLYV